MGANHHETYDLAVYLHDIMFSDLSRNTIETAKMCVEDFIGVSVAGSAKEESRIWKQYYREKCTSSQATLFQPGFEKRTMEQAAALNGVFGHIMDLDDVHNASIAHLGAVTIPSAFAAAQKLHKSGARLIEAVVAGYEAGARVGETVNPSAYRYWHTTGVTGAFSSGTAVGSLLDLDVEQMVNCLGSAGTQASGLWEFLESGSMSKVLHTAHANLCGMRAAELAKLGFSGAPAILEGERGFVKALAAEYDLGALTRGFGEGYRIEENSLKPYACCRHTHSANDCIREIIGAYELCPDDIVSIVDDTYGAAVQTVDNPWPENPYAAKFSIQFCLAAAVVLKDLGDRVFTAENLADPRIRAMMSKIKIRRSPDLDEEFRKNPDRWSHRITVALKSGKTITRQVDYPAGDFRNPFDWSMTDQKFRLLTEDLIGEEETQRLLVSIHNLEHLEDVNSLFMDSDSKKA